MRRNKSPRPPLDRENYSITPLSIQNLALSSYSDNPKPINNRNPSITSHTSGAEPTFAPLSQVQGLNLNYFWGKDLLYDQLCDPIASLHLKVNIRVVEQDNPNRVAVVSINNSSTNINGVLPCKARSWSCKLPGSHVSCTKHSIYKIGSNEEKKPNTRILSKRGRSSNKITSNDLANW